LDTGKQKILSILQQVADPEIPVLSVVDLGIIRNVLVQGDAVEVIITPTYSGCPAMDVIAMNIRMVLLENGYHPVTLSQQLSPAWTTHWMTDEGKAKLEAYGIAPPVAASLSTGGEGPLHIACPLCHSLHTRRVSQFGSTACKALYQCNDCGEPFDYFKCH
jgi:ring-1,2-phenylacetyl-CoA epoxidase subunit PaaD